MIKGIGIDLIELDRIRDSLRDSDRLARRILTDNEIIVFNKLQNKQRQVEFLAGRFAVKEAFAKAAGTGIGKLSFRHIEVFSDEFGAPAVTAKGYESNRIFVSITHSRDYAIAQIVIEDK